MKENLVIAIEFLKAIGIFLLIICMLWFMTIRDRRKHTETRSIKELQTIVNDTTIHITTIKNRIQKIALKPLEYRIDSLINLRLNSVDTVIVIRLQDTIIYEQANEIDTLKNIVIEQDSVINIQDFVIGIKDTIIEIQKVKRKKNRQTILKLAVSSVLLGVVAVVK